MDVEKKIMERYPKLKDEQRCRMLRDRMQGLREAYRQRLIKEAPVKTGAGNNHLPMKTHD